MIVGNEVCLLSGRWMGAWSRGGIFELGEVNAHGVCASVTNKQYFNQPIINWGKQLINNN